MLRSVAFLLVALIGAPAAAELQSVGIYGQWGTFVRTETHVCYATSEPTGGLPPAGWRAFAAIGYWPQRHIRGQLHLRLSRQKRAGSAILLRIDDRTFQLVGGGADAWATDPQADAVIVEAMRSGVEMMVETRSPTGGLIRDSYLLKGAATAIDAAAVACAR